MTATERWVPVLTVAIPTTAGRPWQLQSSADLGNWAPVRSGIGDGIEKSLSVPAAATRQFYRGTTGP